MWHHVRRSPMAHDDRDRFVIAAHHPDRLRRPLASLTAAPADRFQQALIWNVFRTLDLLTPSFWLRRLHVRLTGEASLVPPQIARVHLWQHLPLPPIQRIDGGRPDVVLDVVIETEHTVWTLVAEPAMNDVVDGDQVAIVDAGAWFAGARQHYCGVIESGPRPVSPGSVLQSRYSRSRDSARLRSPTRGPATPARVRWGAIQWSGLTALLQDCSAAPSLPPIERALALDWLRTTGAEPQPRAASRTTISG